MDLRQLRYFIGIVDAGSLSKASAQLHVAQSALSQSLSSLEAELKTRLLIREPRGIAMTEAGGTLYRHGQLILKQVEIAKHAVASASNVPSGRVTVGIPISFSSLLSFKLFVAVRERFPQIRLAMQDSVTAVLHEFVQNGRLDMALLFIGMPERGIDVQPILTEELFLATMTPPDYPVTWEEIVRRPLLLAGRQSGVQRLIRAALREKDVDLDLMGEVDSVSALRSAVAAGMGAAILPGSVGSHADGHDLVLSSFADAPVVRPVALCFPELRATSPAAEAVAAVLKELIGDLVEKGIWRGAKLLDGAPA